MSEKESTPSRETHNPFLERRDNLVYSGSDLIEIMAKNSETMNDLDFLEHLIQEVSRKFGMYLYGKK